MRKQLAFVCADAMLYGSLDLPDAGEAGAGLLLVSGGNEIRSGAHAGQAALAAILADAGYAVLRYDRRGVGDSGGDNHGFLSAEPDLAAALATFRAEVPSLKKIAAFGNCDAAAALMLLHNSLDLAALILANPWTIETQEAQDTLPPPYAIRARYLKKLTDPRALWRLVSGGIDLGKLRQGLGRAASNSQSTATPFAERLGASLASTDMPVTILLADKDRTAQLFQACWASPAFAKCRGQDHVELKRLSTGSHSFADDRSRLWLEQQILASLAALN